ncbi:hypothetical protein ECANGB1_387 [Enterospora canceri]|uniref:Uncharacterized protein n=1 Tax=Enterospora canceri TaxID=1081671 RepID=A0A1Y1S8U7_9MICR|nr:hypothetical protein ECANGB1_387 [Enterospora canceri]
MILPIPPYSISGNTLILSNPNTFIDSIESEFYPNTLSALHNSSRIKHLFYINKQNKTNKILINLTDREMALHRLNTGDRDDSRHCEYIGGIACSSRKYHFKDIKLIKRVKVVDFKRGLVHTLEVVESGIRIVDESAVAPNKLYHMGRICRNETPPARIECDWYDILYPSLFRMAILVVSSVCALFTFKVGM